MTDSNARSFLFRTNAPTSVSATYDAVIIIIIIIFIITEAFTRNSFSAESQDVKRREGIDWNWNCKKSKNKRYRSERSEE